MSLWDREVDLLVFGAGCAGMMAALVGRAELCEVLLCEKDRQVGGSTAGSGGTLWIPTNPLSDKAGIGDSVDDARRYLIHEFGTEDPRGLREAFLESGPEAIEFLDSRTDVELVPCKTHPDYHAEADGGTMGGRPLAPAVYDGRRLGAHFELIRRPREEFMALGGMMVAREEIRKFIRPWASWESFWFVAKTVFQHAIDRLRYSRGTRLLMGNALVASMLADVMKSGVELRMETRLVQLLRKDGQVIGAVVEGPSGTERIHARKGVVLATGGYAASAALREEMMGDYLSPHTLTNPASAGDGLTAAVRIGAAVEKDLLCPALWMPSSLFPLGNGNVQTIPHIRERAKPGLIAVDQNGERFVDEALSYHDFCMAMFKRNQTVPCIPAYLVFDRRFLWNYGFGPIRPIWQILRPFVKSGYLTKAATVAELAERIGVPAQALKASVKAHNDGAPTGYDPHGKGSTALGRHNGDGSVGPNPCLRPIEKAPFFAVPVYPGILATAAGLKTGRDADVLDENDRTIPGLYACGNDMASVMRGSYPGPGTTLGPAVTFAYRAVRHACSRDMKKATSA